MKERSAMKTVLCLFAASFLILPGRIDADDVEILLLIPHRYGANYNFNRDQFEKMGWNITTAAVTSTVQPCNAGLPWLQVDTLIEDVMDVSLFDAVAIMSATWRYQSDPYGDLIGSSETMELITDAAAAGIPLYAPCVAPRVLAAADLLNGVSIQGEPGNSNEFLAEYLAAGAIYLGTHLPPVICGGIITATRGQYYQRENSQSIGTALITAAQWSAPRISTCIPDLTSETIDAGNALWSRTFGGACSDGASDIEETAEGGLIVAGYTYSSGNGNSDMLLLKLDSEGYEIWSRTFGGGGWEYGNSVCQADDGGFIIAGYTTSSGAGLQDVYVVRTDSYGNELWSEVCGGAGLDMGMSVMESDSGDVLVCGYTESMGSGENDIYVIKLTAGGSVLWERTYGGSALETGDCIIQSDDGNYIIAGATGSETTNSDVFLLKTDTEGNPIWSAYYDGAGGDGGYDRGNSVCQLYGGGFAIVGDSNEPDNCGVMFVRTGPDGASECMEFYGGNFYDYGNDIVECCDGGIIVCGASKEFSSCLNSIYVLKINTEGNIIWEDNFGDGNGSQWGAAVCETADGRLVIAGQTESEGAGEYDVWILKIEDEFQGIQHGEVCPDFRVYPNPVTGGSIQLPEVSCSTMFRIYDLSSRCVLESSQNSGSEILDVSALNSGAYIITASRNELVSSQRFVIMN
jgi:putative intracellular protease/amidase